MGAVGGRKLMLHLTDGQSVRVHGWLKPKRTLTWEDIAAVPRMTVPFLAMQGIAPKDIRTLQPDIMRWIHERRVSFEDVPYMTDWPLHPITHLGGDISTLVRFGYPPELLLKLGLDFRMLTSLGLNTQWMKLFDFSLKDWVGLGMTERDTDGMSDNDIRGLFGTDRQSLALCIAMAQNCAAVYGS